MPESVRWEEIERASESERERAWEKKIDRQTDKKRERERAHVSIHVYICTRMRLHDPVCSRTPHRLCIYLFMPAEGTEPQRAPVVCAFSTLGL